MATTLLLVRHAKAKVGAEGQPDFDRELSEAGKRAFNASAESQLAQFDQDAKNVQIWASPAVRTRQTAEILAKALKGIGVKVHGGIVDADALWEQDAQAFLAEVEASEADIVVAVGHNPMIEDLTAQLTGARIPFSTGAMACIHLADGSDSPAGKSNESSNRLLWFAQGPISQRWRNLVQMEKLFRSCSNTVNSRLQAFFDNPDDIETMHKFRVSIRTFRSLVAFAKPWQETTQNASMQEDLKEVVAETSRLRELDVLCEHAQESSASSPALVEFCENEAAAERTRVTSELKSKRIAKRLERIAKASESIRWKKGLNSSGLEAKAIRAHFDEIAADLEEDIASLDLADVEPTHDVRKKAKRVRYVAENYKDLIGNDVVGIAKGMTAHQDNLGAVCDARVNIDIINAFTERDLPEPISWDLTLLRAQNEMFLYTTLRGQHAEAERAAEQA